MKMWLIYWILAVIGGGLGFSSFPFMLKNIISLWTLDTIFGAFIFIYGMNKSLKEFKVNP